MRRSAFLVIFTGVRVLVVEDNEKLAGSLKKGLQQEGYAVDLALDGVQGQLLVEAIGDGYDAVILDVMLPGRDGISVCRAMRAAGNHVPVLLLTARDAVKDRVSGLDAGADDYLPKPFAFEELTARIRALLRRPRDRSEAVLRAADVSLDPVTREVTAGGRAVTLTTKEFSLLELLLRHPRQVLSREQITNNLWDRGFDGNSNVVEVHVKNVRKKLSQAGHNEYIETVRGAGYRLRG
jgi:DNA-binding response OmpR family regulator